MSELREILREEYVKQINKFDLKMLLEMVEDVISSPLEIIAEESAPQIPTGDDETLEMLIRMIPDIAISEIGWSDVSTTEEGEQISGPQRQMLEIYLDAIVGQDLGEKIKSLSAFYSDGAEEVEKSAKGDRAAIIKHTLSYLVFYKTLTKLITNFNASSAGFSFESFLATLSKGRQIETGNNTIADYTDMLSGEAVPISLKLYKEKGLDVGGSYTALIDDLVKPKTPNKTIGEGMRYIACTKTLKGRGLQQEGWIDFYQFDFRLNNVVDILAQSRLPDVIQISKRIYAAIEGSHPNAQGYDFTGLLELPAAEKPLSSEELTPEFNKQLKIAIKKLQDENPEHPIVEFNDDDLKKLLDALNWEKNDEIFNKVKERGSGSLSKKKVRDAIGVIHKKGTAEDPLAQAIHNANAAVIKSQQAATKLSERNTKIEEYISEGEFYTPEESAQRYNSLGGPGQKKNALLSSLGYIRTRHFGLNQTQALNTGAPTFTKSLGRIHVGRAEVAKVLNNVRDILNQEVREIFQSLKALSDSLNQFFAGGLSDDTHAQTASMEASDISQKGILQKTTPEYQGVEHHATRTMDLGGYVGPTTTSENKSNK